ncbi:MAG: L-threonylcarbamoyladenylate synthase [archaeon]
MCRILSKEEVEQRKFRKELTKSIFIYPTDTIYGIGCNALDKKLVARIREAKKSNVQPFSIIAPSKHWIKENCTLSPEAEAWLKQLPGSFTLILPLKNKDAVASNVNNGLPTIGVRIPKHWISKLVEEANVPFITTSANATGDDIMTCIEDLDPRLKEYVHFVINEGKLIGKPSTLVHLEKEKVQIKER